MAAASDAPARVASAPAGTPLYAAGLDVGDVIDIVDGTSITTSAECAAAIARYAPGDRITVAYTGTAGQHTTTITVAENPTVEAVTFEDAGNTPSAEQLAFRTSWLASKAK